MPYVTRNAAGEVITLHSECPRAGAEFLPPEHVDVLRFIYGDKEKGEMAALDLGFIRVIEDVIDALLERNILRFTDLTPAVQDKLNRRRRTRAGFTSMLETEDDLIRF
jgi:hypothetical protein